VLQTSETARKGKAELVALAVLVIILAVLNMLVYFSLQSQINALSADKENLRSQLNSLNATFLSYMTSHRYLNTEYESLNATYLEYITNHHYTDTEHRTLEARFNSYVADHHFSDAEYNALAAPKLIKVNLRAEDTRFFGTPYLRVYGEVCNVGTKTAYSCRLRVVAYQSGGVLSINTYIELGTIEGESWVHVDSNVYYGGTALTSWQVTPEWSG